MLLVIEYSKIDLSIVLAISSLPNLYLGYNERFLEKDRRVSTSSWRAIQESGSEFNIEQGTTLTSEVLVPSNTTGPARVAKHSPKLFLSIRLAF